MTDAVDMRVAWTLDADFLTVNHGSFGATPRPVLAAQGAWRARMEAQPSRFMVETLTPALRAAAARLAGFLGADAAGLGFVENARQLIRARHVPDGRGDGSAVRREFLLGSTDLGCVA